MNRLYELKPIDRVNLPAKMTKPMFKFYRFISLVRPPLTEAKIIKYYKANVMRWNCTDQYDYISGQWKMRYLTKDEIKIYALGWFDRWMGKFVRLEIVSK